MINDKKNITNLYYYLLAFSFLCSLPGNLKAQSQKLQFEHISIEQGLSQSTIYTILQDRDGFMWFGTQDGLNQYDGYTFKIKKNELNNKNSLSSNTIYAMLEDESGILWIGTWAGGLNKYNKESNKFTQYRHDPENPHTIGSNTIYAMHFDKSGFLWLGTSLGGLNKMDRKTEIFTRYSNDPANPGSISSNTVLSICEDLAERLWFGARDGLLNQFDRKTNSFLRYKPDVNEDSRLTYNPINALYADEDDSDYIWVGTENTGLLKFKISTAEFSPVNLIRSGRRIQMNHPVNYIKKIDDKLWIGTKGDGIYIIDNLGNIYDHYWNHPTAKQRLSDNTIRCTYKSNSGIIWIGTDGDGINKIASGSARFKHFQHNPDNRNSLANNMIQVLLADKEDNLWISVWGDGVDFFDQKKNKFTHFRHNPKNPNSLTSNIIFDIFEDKNQILWFATEGGGLCRYNPAKKRFKSYSFKLEGSSENSLYSIGGNGSDTLWLGTQYSGLIRFNKKDGTYYQYDYDPNDPYSISSSRVVYIYTDRLNTLWIGTELGGLNKYDRKNDRFIRYRHDPLNPHSLSNDDIACIYQARNGTLFVATYGGGFNEFDNNKNSFIRYTEKDGLPNNTVYGILEDNNGDLWLSTNNGLSKFNIKSRTFRNFDASDGLQSNEFNTAFARAKDGELYFGGINGFNSFYPDKIKDNTHIPPIIISDFQILNESLSVGDTINERVVLDRDITYTEALQLTHQDYVVSFEFAALDYTNSSKNQYAYKLEGFDVQWNNIGNRRFATYTNIPPGKYTLKVKGSNNDGAWNNAGKELKIVVSPPYWATWWFRGVLILTLFFLIILIYRYRTWQIRKHNIELEKEIEERKRAEKELRKARNYINNIINSMPSVLIGIDSEGRVTHWNQKAEDTTGIKEEQAAGQLLESVFPLLRMEMEKIREAIRSRKTIRDTKIPNKTKDSTHFSDLTIFPLISNGTEGAVIRIDDVTERVRLEEIMIQSEKMLTVGGLAAGMAHEINNPLAGMIQNAQVVQNRLGGDFPVNVRTANETGIDLKSLKLYMEKRQIFDMLEMMLDSGNRTAKIVDNMLSFSRKSTGARKKHEMGNLLDKTLDLAYNDYDLKKKYDFRNIIIEKEYTANIPEILCEETKIEQVILNIIKNAAEAMGQSTVNGAKPALVLRTRREKEHAVIEIKDNGPGIPDEIQKRIFEPFYTTKPVGQGTGLGLSVSYFIITEHHNGKMYVESGPEEGAKFIIKLPFDY